MASNLLLLVEPLNAGRRLDRQTVATPPWTMSSTDPC